MAAHATAKLEVSEHGPEYTTVPLDAYGDRTAYLLDLFKRVPDALEKLKPVLDAHKALAELNRRITESKESENSAAADEARDRENLTALKGNDAAKLIELDAGAPGRRGIIADHVVTCTGRGGDPDTRGRVESDQIGISCNGTANHVIGTTRADDNADAICLTLVGWIGTDQVPATILTNP